jgi:hypothetical protein
MEQSLTEYIIVGFIINLIIFYFLIKAAVKSALASELITEIKKLQALQVTAMRSSGASDDIIASSFDELEKFKRLRKEYEDDKITQEEFKERKKKLLFVEEY